MAEDQSKNGGCYITAGISSALFLPIIYWLWPGTIPFSFLHFWSINGSIKEALNLSWIAFAWGIGVSGIFWMLRDGSNDRLSAGSRFWIGSFLSLVAGVFEEICFRWIFFYAAIWGITFGNWVLFGFCGHGIPHFIYTHALIPIADFCTFHKTHDLLYSSYGWVVGAAIISSNGRFRSGHSYQGLLGWINSWFMGMYFFYLMFHYGLPAAMLVHFLYDFFIDIIVLITTKLKKW